MSATATYSNFGGRLIYESRGGVETEYVSDPLGSLAMCMDVNQNATYTAEYWPYGEVQVETGSNPSSWGFVGLLGYFKDLASLLYVRARHYRPNLTQWQTQDPLWPSELAFGYVNGNPTRYVDYSGLAVCSNPCADIRPKAVGGCIALFCSLQTASDLYKFLLGLFGKGNSDLLKEILNLIKDHPPKSPDDCCKAAANANATSPPSKKDDRLNWLIGVLCKQVVVDYPLADCAIKSATWEACHDCCEKTHKEMPDNGLCRHMCDTRYIRNPR